MVTSREDVVGALIARREARGLTTAALEDAAGLPNDAISDAEQDRASMRKLFGFTAFAAYWLEALGLALVLLPAEQADDAIGRSAAPELKPKWHRAYPNRDAKRPAVRQVTVRTKLTFTTPA